MSAIRCCGPIHPPPPPPPRQAVRFITEGKTAEGTPRTGVGQRARQRPFTFVLSSSFFFCVFFFCVFRYTLPGTEESDYAAPAPVVRSRVRLNDATELSKEAVEMAVRTWISQALLSSNATPHPPCDILYVVPMLI